MTGPRLIATVTTVAGALAAAASAALAAAPALPTHYGPPSKDNPSVRPAQIIYSGDGSGFFAGNGKRPGRLHWTRWNATEALGTGANWIDNCNPNCAKGKFTAYPITLKAYRPRKESKYLIFTRLTVTYTGRKFGPKRTFTWNVSYSGGAFQLG